MRHLFVSFLDKTVHVGKYQMILAGIATYFNSRASVARQSPEAAANPQTAMMNKLALYVFPLGVVVGGPFLPLAIILYWVANNIWTYGQQHYVFGRIEKEEELKKQEDLARRASNAPAPGSKPKRKRPAVNGAAPSASAPAEVSETTGQEAEPLEAEANTSVANPAPAPGAKPNPSKATAGANRAPRRTNNRPKKRRP